MKPLDKVFWLRVGMGILTGAILGILTVFANLSGSNGLLFALLMYMVSYYIARFTVSAQILPKDARKLVTTGLGSFVLLLLFIWILINTLFTAAG